MYVDTVNPYPATATIVLSERLHQIGTNIFSSSSAHAMKQPQTETTNVHIRG